MIFTLKVKPMTKQDVVNYKHQEKRQEQRSGIFKETRSRRHAILWPKEQTTAHKLGALGEARDCDRKLLVSYNGDKVTKKKYVIKLQLLSYIEPPEKAFKDRALSHHWYCLSPILGSLSYKLKIYIYSYIYINKVKWKKQNCQNVSDYKMIRCQYIQHGKRLIE